MLGRQIVLRALSAAAICCGLGALTASAVAAETKANSLPRYHLRVGQELTYRQSTEFIYGKGDAKRTMAYKTDWQAYVTRENGDGSCRVVLRSSQRSVNADAKGKKTEGSPSNTLAYCDIFADGRFIPNDSLGYRLNPQTLFPRLPKDGAAAAAGWEGFHERDCVRSRFTPAPKDKADNLWVFDEVHESPQDAIYLSTSRNKLFFDVDRGLIARTENENTQGYGFQGKGTSTTEFAAVKEHDAAWLLKFAAEADQYFAAGKAYDDLTRRAQKDTKETDALLAKGEATLKDAKDKLTEPMLREQVDEQLKNHERSARWIKEDAKRFAEIIGKPSADWATTSLDGKKHSLDGYRGQVVVLDFWYRGCGWCIRAMPQINQLAQDFKDQPVAVLGMNIDKDEKDALFVVDKMKLTYPSLKAEGLPQKYGVQGYPTLIILDQTGKVADVHVGYSPNLREEVAKSVKWLLAK